MEHSLDRPSPEIDHISLQLFVDRVQSLLPATEWRNVHISSGEDKDLSKLLELFGVKVDMPKNEMRHMASAVYKVDEMALRLTAIDTPDITPFVTVELYHPVEDQAALVEKFTVSHDLENAEYDLYDLYDDHRISLPMDEYDFMERLHQVDAQLQLQQMTNMNSFTADKYDVIMKKLQGCNTDNKIL